MFQTGFFCHFPYVIPGYTSDTDNTMGDDNGWIPFKRKKKKHNWEDMRTPIQVT